MPANKCVQQTALVAPVLRSQRVTCDSTGTHDPTVLHYGTADCTGALIRATQIPDARCIFDGSVTCPAADTYLFATPSPYPTLPGVADGYAVRTGGCTSASCNVGCRVNIVPLGVCVADNSLGSPGDSQQTFCSGGNTIVSVVYDQPSCVSPKFGRIAPTAGPTASCMTERGRATCDNSGAYGALPVIGGAFTSYEDNPVCLASIGVTTLLPINQCVLVNGVGFMLNCHADVGPSFVVQSGSCGGGGNVVASLTLPGDGVCGPDGTASSGRLYCNYVVGRNGTVVGIYSAASTQAVSSTAGVIAAIVAALWASSRL